MCSGIFNLFADILFIISIAGIIAVVCAYVLAIFDTKTRLGI